MDIITRNFFRLLRAGAYGGEEKVEPMSVWKWKRVYHYSLMHDVTALLYDGIRQCSNQFFMQLPEELDAAWRESSEETEQENKMLNDVLTDIYAILSHLQLRPIVLKGQSCASLYDLPDHHKADGIVLFFPFKTQGRKADQWAHENGKSIDDTRRHRLSYSWHGCKVEHCHRMQTLTNKMLNHTLQDIIEKEIREQEANYTQINNARVEIPSATLSVLISLLNITQDILSNGLSLRELVDLGMFLRKKGDKVDFVKLQTWTERLHMERMAQLTGSLLVELLGFTVEEIPFMTEGPHDISRVMSDLFLYNKKKDEMFFQQGQGIFVHASNSSAMFWQVRHSARYFRYYPTESVTHFITAFAHSLSHIEE
jgi:hypothetical protein